MRWLLVLALVLVATVAWAVPETQSPVAIPGSGTPLMWDGERDMVIKWEQLPLVGGNAFASQYAANYPFYAESADDFMCLDGIPIVAVEWWGTYWNPGPDPFAYAFQIRFYENDPGPPSYPIDPPIYEEICYVFTEEWDDYYGQYHYYQLLDVPFDQVEGHIYWVSFVAYLDYPPQWGWCQAELQWEDCAVQDFEVLGVPRWTLIDPCTDLAFRLWGEDVSPVESTTWGNIKALYR